MRVWSSLRSTLPDTMQGKRAYPYALTSGILAVLAFVGALNGSASATPEQGFSFAAASDIGMTADASATLRAVGAAKPDLFLALGDLSLGGPRSPSRWCRFVKARVGPIPVQLVAGDHEQDMAGNGTIGQFARCLPNRMHSTGEYARQYYFDYKRLVRFIFISPDLTIDRKHYFYGSANNHYRWLRQTIRSARVKHIPWVVVGMHKNCLSVGVYYCNVYQELLSLLVQERADLVVHGHDRVYQRSHQLGRGPGCAKVVVDSYNRNCTRDHGRDGLYRKSAGVVFVGVGTGGAPLYDVDASDPEAGYFAASMGRNKQPRKGFLEVNVTRTRLMSSFVGTTRTSSFRDRFAIVRR